ncbi:MAG: ABC transporter ATP-binding protein [candidate division Zixibacteria bacterium RBG_16_53_22]|nr:MAG: ABC transporter ATP-binding protein [candidate division Zixibacteria bacterium RBG_16_53_22]
MWVLRLILRNTGRHKLRTILTILGLAVATMSFVVIRTLISSWYASAEVIPPNRLVTRNAVSLVFGLPLAYEDKIKRVEGVESVGRGNWFGGLYNNDPKNFFANFAVGPEAYLDMYSEFVLPPEQRADYFNTKNGAVAGRRLADRFGWKIGDIIRLTGQIYPGDWEFVLKGIYKGSQQGVDENSFIFHWEYFDERIKQTFPEMGGEAGWFLVKISNPKQAAGIGAAIDDIFKNSPAQTLTETEKEFSLNFLAMMDSLIAGLTIMSYLIIGVILLVLVNTMAMSARERMSEYAVLKTLGFKTYHISGLIVGESLLLAGVGGVLGVLLTYPVLDGISRALQGFFSGFAMNSLTVILSAVFMVVVGILAAIFPVYRALRLSIVEGLRHVG